MLATYPWCTLPSPIVSWDVPYVQLMPNGQRPDRELPVNMVN